MLLLYDIRKSLESQSNKQNKSRIIIIITTIKKMGPSRNNKIYITKLVNHSSEIDF